jgi:hypothetical protein
MLGLEVIWLPHWQLLGPTLAPHLPWAAGCKLSSQTDCPKGFSLWSTTNTLRKLHSNHSWLPLWHNSGLEGTIPAINVFKIACEGLLLSQALVNSSSYFNPGQRGALPLVAQQKDVMGENAVFHLHEGPWYDWCKHPCYTPCLAI